MGVDSFLKSYLFLKKPLRDISCIFDKPAETNRIKSLNSFPLKFRKYYEINYLMNQNIFVSKLPLARRGHFLQPWENLLQKSVNCSLKLRKRIHIWLFFSKVVFSSKTPVETKVAFLTALPKVYLVEIWKNFRSKLKRFFNLGFFELNFRPANVRLDT